MQLKQNSLLQGGKYCIKRVLGQGGFGITYLGVQAGLNRTVAIKEFFMKDYCNRDESTSRVSVISQSGRDLVERFRKKFIKEAQTIAALNCAHIIHIHDIFEENDTAYYVMEHISGGSLNEYVKERGILPEREALKFTRQIGDALSYIHKRKILHLDVKPSNVLLGEGDENGAILIDFGISKRYDEDGGQTSSSPIGISKGFAPLEQYKQGGVESFLPCTDVYSLGATLYFMLTGQNPPDANDIYDDGLPPLPSSISASTCNAIEQAMKPKRKERPQSIADFLFLLNEAKATSNQTEEETVFFDDNINVKEEKEHASDMPKAQPLILTDFYNYILKNNGTYKVALTAKFKAQLNSVFEARFVSNGYVWKTGDILPNPAPNGKYQGIEVTDMSGMFENCSNLASLDVSGFNTINVTNMSAMFSGCSHLINLNVRGFITVNVTDMRAMFQSCSRLTSLDINCFNTVNVTSMSWMFNNCVSLTNLNLLGFNTAKVRYMRYMFFGCYSLTNFNLSSFQIDKNVELKCMFSSCCRNSKHKILGLVKDHATAIRLNSKANTGIDVSKLLFTTIK